MRFAAWTNFPNPTLHLWREGSSSGIDLRPVKTSESRFVEFEYNTFGKKVGRLRFMLFDRDLRGNQHQYENEFFQRRIPKLSSGKFPDKIWFFQDSSRIILKEPRPASSNKVRIHLITAARYRDSELYLWNPNIGKSERYSPNDTAVEGPFWDIPVNETNNRFFFFKFIRNPGKDNETFEPDYANRIWTSDDGNEIWTHSESEQILKVQPQKKELNIFFRQEIPDNVQPVMHIWQENSGFQADIARRQIKDGWNCYKYSVYSGISYGIQFFNPDLPPDQQWEHPDAKRFITIDKDSSFWMLEGDCAIFEELPRMNKSITLKIAGQTPNCSLTGPLYAMIWANKARANFIKRTTLNKSQEITIRTYPRIATSIKFFSNDGTGEEIDRHQFKPSADDNPETRFVILNRGTLLKCAPPLNRFRDPPFFIKRPGAYFEDGNIRFVFHCPSASRVRLIGEWTQWRQNPVEMFSTIDGAYWWTSIPVEEFTKSRTSDYNDDYHGMRYRFLVNDEEEYRDPAGGWTDEKSHPASSRLINTSAFIWSDQSWKYPGWEYLVIYQLHAARFSNRFHDAPPLLRLANEIEQNSGYLKNLGATAILLLPVNEVASKNSWGYDPAFFYAVEEDYGGPDAMKKLVDVCHRNGLAVIVDVVFNHAGHQDNILWATAKDTYFDGDTAWGAMINFDHPQSVHFFAQNLVYLAKEFHIDGFRFDHTHTIIHSHEGSSFVRKTGSGGGWEFLHALRYAVKTQVDEKCILIAEHLPNEWALTNYGGPMDSQWGDDFHDRLVDACKGSHVMSKLAEAMQLTQSACDEWFNMTIYPESHDEVGNVNDRIANVAGFGRGLRMSKVAATVTLLGRGIPMFFMGAESGEHKQFKFGESTPLDLNDYIADPDKSRVRAWWSELCRFRQSSCIKGPSPLHIRFTQDQFLCFSRGEDDNFFVIVNFGGLAGQRDLTSFNLPRGIYREWLNSTWPAFSVQSENEDEHANGGRESRLINTNIISFPDYGAVVLEKVE